MARRERSGRMTNDFSPQLGKLRVCAEWPTSNPQWKRFHS